MLTTIVIMAGTVLAAVAGWQIGGPLGAGVFAGYLCGASVSGLCAARQRHLLRYRPELLMWAMVEGFLFKLAMLLMGGLTFRFVDAAAARVDGRAFLVSYAGAILVVMAAATLAALRGTAIRRPARALLEELQTP